ncbi:outer envelope pore protein 21, chloroplastic-like [Oryza brachyantha]|uniref:Outer envelope pore protein 21, chloroplastic n=1 Tax=Oryza brachyantha TaxID=4533 RepID=J3LIS0_ORYBR|nr:outer envelope pore protein 21, chloroplastic-like [Oryza brachyantha]
METSLRLRGPSQPQDGLRIHAKEKLPIASNALLQAHGEIHTITGAPTYLALLLRNFYPRLSANLGLGVAIHLHNKLPAWDDFTYTLRAKKAIIPFPSNALLGINLKGRLLADTNFKLTSRTAAIELAWTILDLRRGQDVRLKLGYQLVHKMPYFQLRENNWTFNAYMDGKWDVRFDL